MGSPPKSRDELVTALVFRLNDIAEETQRPGYHGHGMVPRFFDEVRLFVQNLDFDSPNQPEDKNAAADRT